MYLAKNGDELTLEQITKAFQNGKALLVHTNQENRTDTGLMLNGEPCDTRGQCYSVWDECWTAEPKSLQQCLAAARV